MSVLGIDVSHHQKVINWKTVSEELKRVNNNEADGFAILRVGYSNRSGRGGLQIDGQWLANVRGCEQYGVPKGVYWYCYDQSVEAATITALQVVEQLKGHTWEYPIFFDVEYEPFNTGKDGSGRSPAAVRRTNTDMILAAMRVLEAAGYYCAVYCSRDFFINYTYLDELENNDKWEAAYTVNDTPTVKNGIWQYSSKNPLKIKGFDNLDCNIAYKDYPAIMRKNGLNGFSAGQQTSSKLYTIKITASKGDKNKVIDFCKLNDIPYQVEE